MNNLHEAYDKEIKQELAKTFGITNVMAIPRLVKVVVNIGLGEALGNKKAIETASEQLAAITGQKPITTYAHRSIATYKLVAGDAIGVKVTLRGKRMYAFLEKLISVVLPRMRDFRGMGESNFDGHGHYTLGFREQIVFPEIEYSKIDKPRGLEVTIVTSARTDERAKRLLELLGMPFKKASSA